MDSLIAQAQEALREHVVPPPCDSPRFDDAALHGTSAAGQAFVHQSSLALFRDAVVSSTPFAAESHFADQVELHRAAVAKASEAKASVERQRDRIGVLSESIARANDEATALGGELKALVQDLAQISARVNPALPESLSVTIPSTGETVTVATEAQAREVVAAQVLEASTALSEAFRLRNETDAVHAAGEQLARETAELEGALAAQRAGRARPAQTDASKLEAAAEYYRQLGEVLAESCDVPRSAVSVQAQARRR